MSYLGLIMDKLSLRSDDVLRKALIVGRIGSLSKINKCTTTLTLDSVFILVDTEVIILFKVISSCTKFN